MKAANKNSHLQPPVISLSMCKALLLLAITLIYANSFQGVFVFDDEFNIIQNPDTHTLGWGSLFGPLSYPRPLVGLSFALNFLVSGLEPWSYHLVNLIVHLIAVLALFGIARRTFALPSLSGTVDPSHAPLLAAFIAGIWGLHPLHTEAVTYVTQRFESMMGMFSLLAFYSAVRFLSEPTDKNWKWQAWLFVVLAGCCKQIAGTIPLLVLLYDYAFVAGSLREIRRKRSSFHVGLWICLFPLLFLNLTAPPGQFTEFDIQPPGQFGGFEIHPDRTWWRYGLYQFKAISVYLHLAIVPIGQNFNYYWPRVSSFEGLAGYVVLVLVLVSLALWSWRRNRQAGFLFAWFFLPLVPTSTIMPLVEIAAERRVYLSLAAVSAGFVIALYRLTSMKVLIATTAVVCAALGVLTVQRNTLYADKVALWEDVVRKSPGHVLAYNNLALALVEKGRIDEAISRLKIAVDFAPNYVSALNNLGALLGEKGDVQAELEYVKMALEVQPSSDAHFNYALALHRSGQKEQAIGHYREALKKNSLFVRSARRLVWLLATSVEDHSRDASEALRLAEVACEVTGCMHPLILDSLGAAYANVGEYDKAVQVVQGAINNSAHGLGLIRDPAESVRITELLKGRLEVYSKREPYREPADQVGFEILLPP